MSTLLLGKRPGAELLGHRTRIPSALADIPGGKSVGCCLSPWTRDSYITSATWQLWTRQFLDVPGCPVHCSMSLVCTLAMPTASPVPQVVTSKTSPNFPMSPGGTVSPPLLQSPDALTMRAGTFLLITTPDQACGRHQGGVVSA